VKVPLPGYFERTGYVYGGRHKRQNESKSGLAWRACRART